MGFSCEAVENNLIVLDIGIGLFFLLGGLAECHRNALIGYWHWSKWVSFKSLISKAFTFHISGLRMSV